ncbi:MULTISPECIES: hypothetical protein [unclassified Herbaspirillum]|uniref:hypothetical protein n=1 Tax=unclassified Herbaspirillum TaxID=2624150 RepID=UPI0011541C07|nr:MULTISPECIES: hypothetical protein [unclassified Herbaspirillum]MBB5393929.1 hypothetical protein [Herbaspirillum sp. SJZ102]
MSAEAQTRDAFYPAAGKLSTGREAVWQSKKSYPSVGNGRFGHYFPDKRHRHAACRGTEPIDFLFDNILMGTVFFATGDPVCGRLPGFVPFLLLFILFGSFPA